MSTLYLVLFTSKIVSVDLSVFEGCHLKRLETRWLLESSSSIPGFFCDGWKFSERMGLGQLLLRCSVASHLANGRPD